MSIQQAVLLAGGRGERLRPLTDGIPKPLVLVAGKPFLEYMILLLKDNGINDFVFLTGYLGEKIQEYFGNGQKWGVKIQYSSEDKPLGTGGALRLAKNMFQDKFFILFGDSYLPIDYNEMAVLFEKSEKKASVAIYDNVVNTDVPFNVVIEKKSETIEIYNKKKDNPPQFNYCDAGVIACSRNVVNSILEPDPISFEEAIYPRLIAEKQLGYYIAKERFYDIGTIERLKVFEQYITRGNP